jgi:tetratricopeptide (TPR) repeat protein
MSTMLMKKSTLIVLAVLCVFAGAMPAWAQLAQVGGKVTDNDKPQPSVQVIYKSNNSGRVFKMKTNGKGEFLQVGVPVDTYTVTVLDASGKEVYKQDGIRVGLGGSETVNTFNIDITKGATSTSQGTVGAAGSPGARTEAFRGDPVGGSGPGKRSTQPKMTKEEYEALQSQKAKAESANVLIKQATDALQAKNWQAAVPPLNQLIAADPNRWDFYSALGDAQMNLGQFEEALASYGKGIQVAEANTAVDSKNPNTDPAKKKAGMARMYTNEGNAYLKMKKNSEAVAAFEKAASMDPNPGTAYFNICATQYNTGNMDGAEAACDKAIAADPNKAEAYFIKGSAMFGKGKMDANNKWTVPPGTTDTLNKYLELAPDGGHANDVKAMLESVGAKIETTYKAKKK